MFSSTSQDPSLSPITVIVERVHPFGVFVRLQDGTRGYIRRRELTLSGDIDPHDVVAEGDEIKAVVLKRASSGRLTELSRRAALPDPWKDFIGQHHVGDIVRGRVKDLFPTGVFVEIIPGVDGFIPLQELATWKVRRPEDVVWAGDDVEAIITHIDRARRKVKLSIRQRIKQLAHVGDILKAIDARNRVERHPGEKISAKETAQGNKYTSEFVGIGSILIVEDDDAVRNPLVQWLEDHGCLAHGVRTAEGALNLCRNGNYGLILVDLNLPTMGGLELIRRLRRRKRSVPVAVMSSPQWLDKNLEEMRKLGVVAVFPKPLDLKGIEQLLTQLARGERPKLQATNVTVSDTQRRHKDLAAFMRSTQPLAERLRLGLKRLVAESKAEAGVVFHLDRSSEKVSVVACTGIIPLNKEAVYYLMDSPVKDIILEGGEIWEKHVSQEHAGKFRKLLELLPFESCIGVPIEACGRVEYALFLFHREAEAFSIYRLRDARAMATLFAAALESHALGERIRQISQILVSGQLSAYFSHEIYNKLSGLDLQIRNLRSDLEDFTRNNPYLSNSNELHALWQSVDMIVDVTTELKRIAGNFQQIMKTTQEGRVDINQLVLQTEALVHPMARRAQVTIHRRLSGNLPSAYGNPTALRQVFLNIMLNAVQHMESKPSGPRLLEVTTGYEVDDDERPIKVRFSDTGPGIHRRLWERIFDLGFTTKPGGSGLGLYISRTLVESMGGRIRVEESLVPLGTTFLVELPAA